MAFGDDYKIWRARSSGTLFTTIRMTEFSSAWLAANEEVICWDHPESSCAGVTPVKEFYEGWVSHMVQQVPLEEYRCLKLLYENPDI